MNMNTDENCRYTTNSCKIVSEYFSNHVVMEESAKEIIKDKQSTTKKSQSKTEKVRRNNNKRIKGQKDIRTLIKSKKNELLKYTKDFDLVCKQSGIDVDPEQLQLAIALSKSLQDNKVTANDHRISEKSLTCNQRRSKIRTTLQEYGFKTKTTITKRKKYRKPYKLMLVSDTEKKQKIADKYAHILIKNVCIPKVTEESLSECDNIKSYLYNLATNVTYDSIKNDDIFYVNDLVPQTLHRKHIFKDWSKIPGRPLSPKLEKQDINLKSIKWSQEELNNVLSGSIAIAQDFVKLTYNSDSYKPVICQETSFFERNINQENFSCIKSKESIAEICESKTIKDNSICPSVNVVNNNDLLKMSLPINRSCSPDLFDDEVTIIMDGSKDKISLEGGISKRTIMVKEQTDFMELTDCIGMINSNYTDSKYIACLSQGSNKTRTNLSDFMDLTECVPSSSQKTSNNLQCTGNYEDVYKNSNAFKINNHIEVIELKQFSNDKNSKPSRAVDQKSLDDTIVMINEDYNDVSTPNIGTVVKSTEKIINLVETQYKASKITANHSNSIVDLEHSLENNIEDNNIDKSFQKYVKLNNKSVRSIPSRDKWNNEENSNVLNCNKYFVTVDLTQPSKDYLSAVNVTPIKSIDTNEIHTNSEGISNDITVLSRISKNNKTENKNAKIIEKCEDFEVMDLTQSFYSKDKSLDDTISINDEQYESIILKSSQKYSVDFHKDRGITNKMTKTNLKETIPTIVDIDNDREFDNLLENVSSSKQSNRQNSESREQKNLNDDYTINLLDNSKTENKQDNQDLDLTRNYDCFSDKFTGPKESTDTLENIKHTDNECDFIDEYHCVLEVTEESNLTFVNTKQSDNKSSKLDEDFQSNRQFDIVSQDNSKIKQSSIGTAKPSCEIEEANYIQLENASNVLQDCLDIVNSDIDLTQQSDSSDDKFCSPKIIVVPDELGKRNNISIDYDDVCGETTFTKYLELTPSLDIHKFEENHTSGKDVGVSGSSQHSEIFELSDNEFNYSINQQIPENESSTLKPTQFDIGGISVIDEFLTRNSLRRRSELRCSCNLNGELNINDNGVETCVPVVTLKNNENLSSKNLNGTSKSCVEIEFVKTATPLKSRSDNNILVAKTPKHDDYIIKTDHVTPMPNYENMTSPERNEELDKFGIKPLKRKRAIQILTHIYNQTHPLMEVMSNDEFSSPIKIRKKNSVESFPKRTIAAQIDSIMTKHSTESSNDPLYLEPLSKSRKEMCQNLSKSPEKNLDKEDIMYKETTLKPDIRNIECAPEDWVFQKREKAKVHSCRVPLHIAFHNYVSCRKALREAILKYEPINIDDIHKGLVAIGYRYNPKDLLKFMDKKCITVKTADNLRNNKNKNDKNRDQM